MGTLLETSLRSTRVEMMTMFLSVMCLSLRTTQAVALVAFAPQPLPHTVRRRVPVLQLPGTAIADGTADEPQSSIDFEFEVRERVPPPYPEGLHEAAKADRAGPFWSTLGEPDDKSGIRPSYLRRDDWHISSTYTNDERAAMEAEEQEWIAAKDALSLGAVVKEEEWLDPDREREHMKFEKTLAQGAVSSKLPMPQSWQEYQFMQEQLAQNTVDERLSPKQRKEAAELEQKLANFYSEFKIILAEGWTLENNADVEATAQFLLAVRKTLKDPSLAEGPKFSEAQIPQQVSGDNPTGAH